MDCKTARLLLDYARPSPAELEPDDTQELARHLESCGDCDALSQAERQFHDRLGRAMRAVPVPPEARERLLAQLQARAIFQVRRRLFTGLTAAAAVVLCFVGGYMWLSRPAQVDVLALQGQADRFKSAEDVEDWLRREGLNVAVPPRFNYDLLAFCEMVDLHGKRTPLLFFVQQAPHGVVHARVYVLTDKKFDLERLRNQDLTESGSHSVAVWPSPENPHVAYLIVYRGDSLAPFLSTQQQPAA